MDQAQCLFLSCEPDLGTTSWKNIWSWPMADQNVLPFLFPFSYEKKKEQEARSRPTTELRLDLGIDFLMFKSIQRWR